MPVVAGVDVGGTFTDVVFYDGESVRSAKTLTTSPQSTGVLAALRQFDAGAADSFLHGTTAATNALLEGKGGRVALVTTPGFEDVIEIGRQSRPSLYDLTADRPEPLVERHSRIGHEDIESTLRAIAGVGPDAVAVALLGSYRDPGPEEALADDIRSAFPGMRVVTSTEVSPGFREYERIATTAIDAYLAPVVGSYLEDLERSVSIPSASVMTSSGGLATFAGACRRVGQLTLSGPAAGVVAADALRNARGIESIITFDMGGTSTDVARVGPEGVVLHQMQLIGGRVNRVPSMPIHTVGAGGGSIGWRDPGGALRVGPVSAGAEPGPASYGRGGVAATVTDANVFLGLIPDLSSVATDFRLDRGLAEKALASLGGAVGLSTHETALGILEVVDAHMSRALRRVSIEEGFDPRDSSLVAFGGAGGLHATRLARDLEMRSVLVPPHTGAFSALGLLMARPRVEQSRTILVPAVSDEVVDAGADVVRRATVTYLESHGSRPDEVEIFVDARYASQAHELTIPYRAGHVREDFEEVHRARYGFDIASSEVEVVNIRGVAAGPSPLTWDAIEHAEVAEIPPMSTEIWLGGSPVQAMVHHRAGLGAGTRVEGPAIVVDGTSTVLVGSGERAVVHEDGALEIGW